MRTLIKLLSEEIKGNICCKHWSHFLSLQNSNLYTCVYVNQTYLPKVSLIKPDDKPTNAVHVWKAVEVFFIHSTLQVCIIIDKHNLTLNGQNAADR